MDTVQFLKAPEFRAYIEHEVTCPFCDSTMLSLEVEGANTYYKCGNCLNGWDVKRTSVVDSE